MLGHAPWWAYTWSQEDGPVDAVEEGSIIILDGGLVSTTDLFGTVVTGSHGGGMGCSVVRLSAQCALACT
jgi:hypothetical protein